MNTYTAEKNGEKLEFITAQGPSSSETMKNIRSACDFLDNDVRAVSCETIDGWKVYRK